MCLLKGEFALEKIAVIQLGVTKIDLVLADILPEGNFVVREEMSETVKIGSDLEADGLIRTARISEAMSVLKMYKTFCDVCKVTNVIAVSSPMIRELKNHRSFFDEIYNVCGFKFRVLSQEEELSALYTGVINTLDIPKALVVEVCGTYTNLVYYNRRNILNQHVLPIGAYTLLSLVQAGAAPEKICQSMVDFVKDKLKNIEWLQEVNPEFSFVGVGNAFMNAGMLSRKLKKYPVDIAHNYIMSNADFNAVYDLVKTLDVDKTKRIKGISGDRSDVLASGICIIKAISDALSVGEFIVSAKGVKEGLVFNLALPTTNEKPISDLLGYGLETINAFYDRPEDNAKQVGELSLILFRQLKVLHKLSRGYLKVLRIASLMHDCGQRIKFYNHEKNSFHIILNSDIYGATHREIVLAAFASSCQDLNDFSLAEWVKYKDILLEEDLAAVKKLAIIIRIAEALDKTHRNIVQDISCDVLGDSVIMKTIVTLDASIEVKEAMKSAQDFRKIYGKNLEVL